MGFDGEDHNTAEESWQMMRFVALFQGLSIGACCAENNRTTKKRNDDESRVRMHCSRCADTLLRI